MSLSSQIAGSSRQWLVGHRQLQILQVNAILHLFIIASQASASVAPSASSPSSASSTSLLSVISSQGINVPKRPAIIAGLNHQFNRANSWTNSSSPIAPHRVSGILAAAVGLVPSASSFGSLASASNRIKQANATITAGNLFLDRHQQELLAANPTISTHLLTRSDGPTASTIEGQSQSGAGSTLSNGQRSAPNNHHQQPIESIPAGQQQLHSYRGYSLIELEVKSEQDRRYVQDLYANLSAALNEQAQRPNSFTVSPYVDIDFWSFKSDLNDQIDIMVSPKSRAFILNQLSRARVKHRIKIDDIQAKLDQQQPSQSNPSTAGGQPSGHSVELIGRQSSSSSTTAVGAGKPVPTLGEPQLNGRFDAALGAVNMNDSSFFENYQRLADINQYLESIVARARDIARVQVIGRSSQGRHLRVLRLGYEQSDLDGSTGPLMEARSDLDAETDNDNGQLSGKLGPMQPVQLNASTILDQFFKRQLSVKKLGSIWLDGGTHAREWISPATVLYLSFRLADNHAKCRRFFDYLRTTVALQQQQQQQQQQQSAMATRSNSDHAMLDNDLLNGINDINTSLLQGTGMNHNTKPRPRTELEQMLELIAKRPQEVASEHACDLELEQLVRKYTFYIMPVLNPDGYEYSHTHNRLWRKTRSTSNHPIYRHFCLGADPNRNYDARHGSTGSSSHPCSQTYGGTTPFTEPETRHQSNFVYSHRDTLKMYISFHSYSQMILLPFSHSKQFAPDHKDLESVGQAGVKAIERTHGTQYRVGASAAILYTASGTASDWAYEKAGIKYSYTIELRDTGTYGFLLPRNQIIPTGEETFNGLLAMIGQMEKNDNLLTSKSSSSLFRMATGGSTNATAAAGDSLAADGAGPSSTAGLVHAPDMDQFRPFGRFRPKPAQLENALDGTDTWATYGPQAPGVRERTPAPAQASNHIVEDEPVASMSDEEPDAGLAFEGEGELMEPTNNLSVSSALNGQSSESAAETAAKLFGHIYAHSSSSSSADAADELAAAGSGRQTELIGRRHQLSVRQRLAASSNQLGLSANGRSLINQPALPSRTTPSSPRRESSNSNDRPTG
jgi:hypothetical protein